MTIAEHKWREKTLDALSLSRHPHIEAVSTQQLKKLLVEEFFAVRKTLLLLRDLVDEGEQFKPGSEVMR